MGLLPLELLLTYEGHHHAHSILSWQWLRLPRWFVRWQKSSQQSSITARTSASYKALRYLVLLLVVSHVFACVYCWASEIPAACTDDALDEALAYARAGPPVNYFSGGETVGDLYVYCLYAAFALILGDASYAQYLTRQRAAGLVFMLVGELTMAAVFGQVRPRCNGGATGVPRPGYGRGAAGVQPGCSQGVTVV